MLGVVESSTGRADILADAAVDFSGTQGQANWRYGIYNVPGQPATYAESMQFNSVYGDIWSSPGQSFGVPLLFPTGGHPGETTSAVRRWTSPTDATISLDGEYQSDPQVGGGITTVRVWIDGVAEFIANTTTSPATYHLGPLAVHAGSIVDFEIDPFNGYSSDSTRFTVSISGQNQTGPLAIVAGPATVTLRAGLTATFTVSATGAHPLHYQWQRDTVDIPGATSAALALERVQSFDAGSYRVIVSDASGSIPSTPAVLTVLPGITYIPEFPVAAISADGRVAVGGSYRWTPRTGAVGLGNLPTSEPWNAGTRATAVSGDGSVVVGSANLYDAFRWTTAGGIESIYAVPGLPSSAYGVSSDGVFVVGQGWNLGAVQEAFRWSSNGGLELLGRFNRIDGIQDTVAYAASSDGGAIAGVIAPNNSPWAFRWTPAGGIQSLGLLPGAGQSVASAISAEGNTVVGTSFYDLYRFGAPFQAFLWTAETGMIPLGFCPGCGATPTDEVWSRANAISGDGFLIGGSSKNGGPHGDAGDAFLWDPVNGMRYLKDILRIDYGVEPEWIGGQRVVLGSVTSISADGGSLAGTAYGGSPYSERGFLVSGFDPHLPSLPRILTQPQSRHASVGDAVILAVSAEASAALTYQWRKDGTPIAGANSSTLAFIAQSADQGSFDAVVSTPTGSITSAAASLVVDVPVPVSAPAGLLAWWRAENNVEDAVGGLNGDLQNGATFMPGEVGQAFFFDGVDDGIIVPTAPVREIQDQVTMEGWVLKQGSGQGNAVILSARSLTGGCPDALRFALFIYDDTYAGADNGKASIAVNTGAWQNGAISTTVIPDNAWTHVAGTYDGAFLRIYVNGILESSVAKTGPILPGTDLLEIGRETLCPDEHFLGAIDELSLYDRALTGEEIAAIVDARHAGKQLALNPPVVNTQPQSQTVTAGGSVSLTVGADGDAPLTYQWRKEGVEIPGATSNTLAINSARAANAGTYDVLVHNSAGTVTSATATLTVNKAVPGISWSSPLGAVYGTVLGPAQLNAVADIPGAFSYTPAAGTMLLPGSDQTLTAQFTPDDPDSFFPATVAVIIQVGKAPLTLIADDKSKTYGAPMPALTWRLEGLVNGDTAAVLTQLPSLTTTARKSSATGTYPITVSGGVAENYEISRVNGTVTVTPATLTVAAVNKSNVYGTPLPAFSAVYSGFVNGDSKSDLDSLATFTTPATQASDVGTYPIVPRGAAGANYTVTFVNGTLVVTPHNLTIRAQNKSKLYGDPLPQLTAAYSGFVNGDTIETLDTPVILEALATEASQVGTYTIAARGASDANYTITFVDGALAVYPATLTVTAMDASSVYGESLPTLNYLVSGFVLGETEAILDTPVVVSTTAIGGCPAGRYPISVSGASDSNYRVRVVGATLTVGKAPLTIRADDLSRPYGTPNPTLTATYTGFVNGDSAASLDQPLVLATAATLTSPPGRYAIKASDAKDANYAITLIRGTLTILP